MEQFGVLWGASCQWNFCCASLPCLRSELSGLEQSMTEVRLKWTKRINSRHKYSSPALFGFLLYDFDRNRPASSPVPCPSLSGLCKHFSDTLQVVRDRLNYPSCKFPYRRSFLFDNASKFPSRSSHNVAESSPSVSGFRSLMPRFVETQVAGNIIAQLDVRRAQNIYLNISSSIVRRIQSQVQIGARRILSSCGVRGHYERATVEELARPRKFIPDRTTTLMVHYRDKFLGIVGYILCLCRPKC